MDFKVSKSCNQDSLLSYLAERENIEGTQVKRKLEIKQHVLHHPIMYPAGILRSTIRGPKKGRMKYFKFRLKNGTASFCTIDTVWMPTS